VSDQPAPAATRDDLGFLLAKAAQRWNEALAEAFAAAGYDEVRPAYGSVLIPLFEQDGLRMGELARRGRLSKQTMTQLVRRLEADGLVERRVDPRDGRASLISLTARSRAFRPVAEATLDRLDRRAQDLLGAARVRELRAALGDVVEHGLA
jgi:DNA-binding MarR family transcriptional regulator